MRDPDLRELRVPAIAGCTELHLQVRNTGRQRVGVDDIVVAPGGRADRFGAGRYRD